MRYRSDEINRIVSDEGQDGTGAENEHQSDDGRRDHDGAADIPCGRTCFAGENGYVLKSAERADGEFAKDVEAIKNRHGGGGDLERVIMLQFAAGQANERQGNQGAVH